MNYVVVGASAAGINGVRTLRQLDPTAKITLISQDEHIYSRCILHHYIEGSRNVKELSFVEEGFIENNQIDWVKGALVTGIDPARQELYLSNEETVPYDKVLLATGASTFYPPVPNLSIAKNVVGLRTLADAAVIREKITTADNIVVMGAGLVGIDAVEGLVHRGKRVTLVEFGPRLLPIQLDERAAQTYQVAFEKAGVNQFYETAVKEVIMDEEDKVAQLQLSDGQVIDCDLLIVATGVRANVQFIGDSIDCDRFGLLFDAMGRTNCPNVYGAGDISGRNPIWPAAVKEGIVAASNMVGVQRELTDFFASKSTMTFLNIHSLSLGKPYPEDETYTVEIDDQPKVYRKIIHKDGVIHGAIIQGDLSYTGILTQMVKKGIPTHRQGRSLFEVTYADFFDLKENLEFAFCQQGGDALE
ncbi:NAD(P)/FAD-dependent oxidoreductase [Enterococcus casseliflavus]|uniref:NAD(P)/FAD-dependent oxidoreductase n=1 Tax=Enterococcus casseliflavus TaxID=37734 RepID=UPI00403CEEFC